MSTQGFWAWRCPTWDGNANHVSLWPFQDEAGRILPERGATDRLVFCWNLLAFLVLHPCNRRHPDDRAWPHCFASYERSLETAMKLKFLRLMKIKQLRKIQMGTTQKCQTLRCFRRWSGYSLLAKLKGHSRRRKLWLDHKWILYVHQQYFTYISSTWIYVTSLKDVISLCAAGNMYFCTNTSTVDTVSWYIAMIIRTVCILCVYYMLLIRTIRVFPKIVVPQNGWWKSWKPLFFNGWFGGKTHHLRKHPYC